MKNKDEAMRWLLHAKDELIDAKILLDANRYYHVLFLAQQIAEKAIKAFIYSKINEPIFTHSIFNLLKIANELDPDFGELRHTKRLDDYYVPTRYPNGLPGGIPSEYYDDPEETKEAFEMAKSVISFVEAKLGMKQNTD